MKKMTDFTVLKTPLKKPIRTNLGWLSELTSIRMKLWLGPIAGIAFVYPVPAHNVKALIERVQRFLIPFYCERLKWLRDGEPMGPHFWDVLSTSPDPIHRAALALVDIAIWDGLSKLAGVPFKRLIKNNRDDVEVYATTGWLSLSNDDLLAEGEYYRKKGVKGFKIRLGHEDDLIRLQSLREQLGQNFYLMADANRQYAIKNDLEKLTRLNDFNLRWLEEPLQNNSIADYRTLRSTLNMPFALGESLYDFKLMERFLKSHLISVIQPDLLRCGGLTGLLKVSRLAEKYDIPICNHLLAPLTANVISASPKALLIEYDDLFPLDLFKNDFSITLGKMALPNVPGVGTALNEKLIRKYIC